MLFFSFDVSWVFTVYSHLFFLFFLARSFFLRRTPGKVALVVDEVPFWQARLACRQEAVFGSPSLWCRSIKAQQMRRTQEHRPTRRRTTWRQP